MDNKTSLIVGGAVAAIGVVSLLFLLSRSPEEATEEVPEDEKPAASEPATPPVTDEPADAEAPAPAKDEAKEVADALAAKKAEYDKYSSVGVKYIKATRYQQAIDALTKAIDLSDDLPNIHGVDALYNNRGAAYEKAGKYKESLQDCTYVLTNNPKHIKVRKRRARIYKAQERLGDALVELCVIILTQREEMKAASYSSGYNPMTQQPPQPPEGVDEVMQAVGAAGVEDLWEKRDTSKLKGRMASRVAVGQLLLGYTEYLDIEKEMQYKTVDDLTSAAETTEGAEKAMALKDLAFYYMTQRAYKHAKKTLDRAHEAAKEACLEGPALAHLLSWVGVFEHLCYQMDAAEAHYEQARAADPDSADILVKQAGVCLDKGDLDGAEKLYSEAEEKDPGSTDLLYHRAQLWVIKRDMERAVTDLRACIEKEPTHTIAIVKLACLLMNNDNPAEVNALIDQACEQRPNLSEVYQVKGELALSSSTSPDMEAALKNFEAAIDQDDTNALARVYKALTLYQSTGMNASAAIPELEKAIDVDPTCIRAYYHLAELKLTVLKSLDEGFEVVHMLETAADWCHEKNELQELSMLRGVAKAQLEAAKQLGLTSLS